MTTALLPAQRAALHNLTRHHRGDTMLTFYYPTTTTEDAPPNWYIQAQLDAALQQARQEEATMSTPTAAHTPGPWHVWQRNAADGWITDTPERDDDRVPFGTNIIAKVQNVGHWPTRDANARLIAAAPELLEALETIQEQLKAAWGRAHYEEIRIAMHIARAAIAKATGEVLA